MKTNLILLTLISLLFVIQACKKDGTKPKTAATTSQPVTITQSLAGKWYFTEDTVKAADSYTPIVFPQVYRLSHLNYIVFNGDSTAVFSDQIAHDALITDYIKLYVNPNEPLESASSLFKFKGSSTDSTLVITKANGTSIGYAIKKLNADSLVLFTQTEIAKYPHDYRFAQYIHFSR